MLLKFIKKIAMRIIMHSRILKFRLVSNNSFTGIAPKLNQPLILLGKGSINFDSGIKIGIPSSPSFWSTECYLEARTSCAVIEIAKNTRINNNFSVIAEYSKIVIGENCLIGHDVYIIDSDFHQSNPDIRHIEKNINSQPVEIGNNVFIGSHVKILKGSSIGDGSLVAAGSIVNGKFPERSLIAGNPGRLIKTL